MGIVVVAEGQYKAVWKYFRKIELNVTIVLIGKCLQPDSKLCYETQTKVFTL